METVRYLYNGANQVACVDADANGACNGTEFWVYDAHGNLTFDRTTRYVYDAVNHLKTVCDSGDGLTCDALGNETTYQYNGDGARVAQSVRKGILPAEVTTYTLDTALPLTQVLSESTNGQTTRYLNGLDLIAQSDGTATEYLAYDGLGSVRQLVDGSGAVLTSQTFDPYGTPYSVDEQAESSFAFTGEQTDENGLVYLRARYYNPDQGRFMQVDPSRMERNGYQYAGSSPTMYTDPSGNCASLLKVMGAFFEGFVDAEAAARGEYNPAGAAVEAAIAECKANIAFYQSALHNPNAPHAPAFRNVMAQAEWKMMLGPTLEDFFVGTTEQAHSFNRLIGAGPAGRRLGREDTSAYYFNRPDRYAMDMVGGTSIVMAGVTLLAPDPSDFGILSTQALDDVAYRGSDLAYDQLTLESSVLLDSGEAIPIDDVVTAMKYGRWLLNQEEAAQPLIWQNTFQPTSLRQLDIVLRNDPTGLYRKIDRIIKKYPLGNYCERCSKELYTLFTKAGYTAQVGRIDTRARFITLADNTLVSDGYPPFHEFVVVNDTVYDAITGAQGMYISDYLNLYYPGVFTDGTATLTYFSP